jgi:[ribosomal protein S5]-alanine N-acetyltransferase
MQTTIPPSSFRTERLFCRRPELEDSELIFARYAQDPEVTRYLMWSPHSSIETTREFLKRCLTNWERSTSNPYAICLNGPRDLIGMIHMSISEHMVEFAYVLAKPYWGKGYMTETLIFLVDWALGQGPLFRAHAFCDCENLASARVMKKAGMMREGILRRWSIHPTISNEPRDCFVYSKTK